MLKLGSLSVCLPLPLSDFVILDNFLNLSELWFPHAEKQMSFTGSDLGKNHASVGQKYLKAKGYFRR